MPLVSWAQAKEDIYLLRALHGVRHDVDNAFYIDVGANDPEYDSVTKLFYDCGWHGVNVEPSPTWYRRLVEQRPRDINIQAAVSDNPGELTFYDHAAGGLGTLVESIAASHRAEHQVALEALSVKAITLTEICEKYAPENIHFLKVDVEGAEGAVLRSMDFRRFRPWVLCVESHVPLKVDLQTHGEWNQYLIDSGYKFVFTDRINRYYLANEHADRAIGFTIAIDEFVSAREFRRVRALEERLRTIETQLNTLCSEPQSGVARQIAERVGFKGGLENALYRAFTGSEKPVCAVPGPVGFASSLCQQSHFGFDQYRFWVQALKERPLFYRKQWEFVYIAQVLFERGYVANGRRGVVFGAGTEPLPALFASFGVEILATDQSADTAAASGWARSNQYTCDVSALNQRGICTERMFKELVSFETVDMNNIPGRLDSQFDFCWSACALEHLGSLRHGLTFMERAMDVLKPGGLAVHTTEFNLSSNEQTYESPDLSIYRKRDIKAFIASMADKGFRVSPVDWTVGDGFAETVVDVPPYGRGEPHIRLNYAGYDVTSLGLIIQKP